MENNCQKNKITTKKNLLNKFKKKIVKEITSKKLLKKKIIC